MLNRIESKIDIRHLCSEGMLFEVQELIQTGRCDLSQFTDVRHPLAIAAGRGFQSLVRTLLPLSVPEGIVDTALCEATKGGHLETAKLLLANGASAASVPAAIAVRSPNPKIPAILAERGLDLATGNPLAHALVARSHEALAFYRHQKTAKSIRIQGAMALRQFVCEDDEQWVTLLRRAGACPRHAVPSLNEDGRRLSRLTAQQVAAMAGKHRMLRRLGVRKGDRLDELMEFARIRLEPQTVKFLLHRGHPLNDQPNGGSTLLNACLCHMGHVLYVSGMQFQTLAESAWKLAVELAQKGAKWRPDKSELRSTRAMLTWVAPTQLVQVAAMLLDNAAADLPSVKLLFGTAKMRQHLGGSWKEIQSLLSGATV